MRLNPRNPNAEGLADELDEIAIRCASRPILDDRPADAILDYDDHGLPR